MNHNQTKELMIYISTLCIIFGLPSIAIASIIGSWTLGIASAAALIVSAAIELKIIREELED